MIRKRSRAYEFGKLKQFGFTLIELMITVGVVGILISLAAPLLQRYQSKARQSEAKIGLAGVFSLERSFYSEYSAYAPDLGAIGYLPEGATQYYVIGWQSPNYSGSITGYAGGFSLARTPRVGLPTQGGGGSFYANCTAAGVDALLTPAGSSSDPQTFSAGAGGNLRNALPCDMWSIDHLKTLKNTQINL